MRWQDFGRSENIEDRRGLGSAAGRGGLGIGAVIVLGLLGWALGIDPRLLIGGAEMVNRMR
ncbi:MAG TPA: neutral zinc metallopeptidase, partial [Methylocella sp.]|nr:neutral zinc metallopeptidase [Methylocella sp.]